MKCHIYHLSITWGTFSLFLLWGYSEYCWLSGGRVSSFLLPLWLGLDLMCHTAMLCFTFLRNSLSPTAAAPFGTVGAPCHGSAWALSWLLHFVLLITPPDLQIPLTTHLQVLCSSFLLLFSLQIRQPAPKQREGKENINTTRAFWRLGNVPHALCAQSKTIGVPI